MGTTNSTDIELARGMVIDYTYAGVTTRLHVTNKRGDVAWVESMTDLAEKRRNSHSLHRTFWKNAVIVEGGK